MTGKFVDNEARRAAEPLPPVLPYIVGRTIAAVLLQRGLTLTATAKFVGVSHVAVWRWRAGTAVPSQVNLTRLALAFGVEPEFLLKFDQRAIDALTRAIRPGEFMSQAEDAALRDAERYAREAPLREEAARKEAERLQEAARLQEPEDRRRIRQQLRDPSLNGDWRSRFAIAGQRCIFCAKPMPAPGICFACLSRSREDD